jgi:dolichyl-phosphate-mannose-protein mannosyltransferase
MLNNDWIKYALKAAALGWVGVVFAVFWKFLPLTYGLTPLTKEQVEELRWKDTWDLIVHKK